MALNGINLQLLQPQRTEPLPVQPLQLVDGRSLAPTFDPNAATRGMALASSILAPLQDLFKRIGDEQDPVRRAQLEDAKWLLSPEGSRYRELKRSADLSKITSDALQSKATAGLLSKYAGSQLGLDAEGNISVQAPPTPAVTAPGAAALPTAPAGGGQVTQIGTLPSGEVINQVEYEVTTPQKIPGTNISVPTKTKKTEVIKSSAEPTGTDSQQKAAKFAGSMFKADKKLEELFSTTDFNPSSVVENTWGRTAPRLLTTPEFKRYNDLKNAWIAAALRDESGAAIQNPEYKNMDTQYFPQPGDPPELVEAKAELRKDRMELMKTSAGPLKGTVETAIGKSENKVSGVASPKTKAEYDALPAGTSYIDPKDGEVYTKGGKK